LAGIHVIQIGPGALCVGLTVVIVLVGRLQGHGVGSFQVLARSGVLVVVVLYQTDEDVSMVVQLKDSYKHSNVQCPHFSFKIVALIENVKS